MKILLLTNLYPPFVRGGAEYVAAQVARELKRQGHEVVVVTSAPWKSIGHFRFEVRDEAGINVYRFFPPNLYHYLSASRLPKLVRSLWQIVNLFNFPAALIVRRICRLERPEAIVSFNLMGLSFVLPRCLRRLSIPLLHTLHDVQLLHPGGLFLFGREHLSWAMRLYQLCTRWLFAPVALVISPSRWLLEQHTRRGFFPSSRALVLPNPAPLPSVTPQTKTIAGPVKLLYLGQLEEHKGIWWLLDALKGFSRSDFVLTIVPIGASANLERLRGMIAGDERFVIHDLPTQAEIDTALDTSHLTVVPSLCYENAPTVITQSFLAGTPVLAPRLGGIPELVEDNETGWLYAPGNTPEFCERLNKLLHQPEKLLQAGLKASRRFSDRTLQVYAQKLVELLRVNP